MKRVRVHCGQKVALSEGQGGTRRRKGDGLGSRKCEGGSHSNTTGSLKQTLCPRWSTGHCDLGILPRSQDPRGCAQWRASERASEGARERAASQSDRNAIKKGISKRSITLVKTSGAPIVCRICRCPGFEY